MTGKKKHIIFCNCRGARIPRETLDETVSFLETIPSEVTILSDLCGIAAKKRNILHEIPEDNTDFLVIGCYPRTMKILLEQAEGFRSGTVSTYHVNLLETPLAAVKEQVNTFCSGSEIQTLTREISEDSGWPSWYPVIDYSRCTSCGQCADFCLFGVYDKTPEKVIVVNPEGCKDQCPACARICPATAIIFPKYKHGGAVGGSDDIDEKAELQRQARDIESILGDDIYLALQKRKEKRRSIIREEEMRKAISERDNALKNKN